jgi:hypothetical protein
MTVSRSFFRGLVWAVVLAVPLWALLALAVALIGGAR